ncbi:MAG: response regulator [Deltaproteobacteria bacterium]|nr:response regulator [Deltaproteobacteria bacterium]
MTPSLSILLVDDDATIRRVVRRHLIARGHEVVEASDGSGGVELLGTRAFDVVIVDLRMPQVDGLALTAHARTALGADGPAIWIMTGSVDPGIEGAARQAGADAVILKPFQGQELDVWLARLAARRSLDDRGGAPGV